MEKEYQFVVFHTDKSDGQMNTNPEFYKEGTSKEERMAIMNFNKGLLAHEIGFSKERLFMTLQDEERGTSYTLTKEDVTSHRDLYTYDVFGDLVKMTPATMQDKTAIGFNVSDGANVIAMNLKTMEAVSAFCSGRHINAQVPLKIMEVLGGNPEDVVVDISPFAYILPMVNDKDKNFEPEWVSSDTAWTSCLYRDLDGTLWINQRKALERQLLGSGILEENMYYNGDSYYNRSYYSTQRARLENNPQEDGRFMHAVAYIEEDKNIPQTGKVRVYRKRYQ